MKTKLIVSILSIILSIFLFSNAQAASLRCGVRLITVGDYKARVLAECGEPDHVEVWEEERVTKFRRHPGYYGIYEHGPGRFMDHLRLENGIVRGIKSGDYGY
jgi:hypothetical protein